MNLYWGDLHNHCGITYGYGTLEHALSCAKNHLDFCAITGHAMWPDMYERTKDTKFVVDFHNKGFKKLYDYWEDVRVAVATANDETFVTFQSYEMHSSEYGDHHIITPDDSLPLIYRNTPHELKEDSGCDAIMIAHHIGYTPGYRGIDWEKYDGSITPLIEVCSKHGCAMSETAVYPYYHNMGPRDSRNTVYEGLKRGYHFGFVGSTDHHAGYPGSYGDGKLAVWAEKKTRDAIWEALKSRRTYAVTGDRIKCQFDVNGHVMGSDAPAAEHNRKIHYAVEGCYEIDKVIIYRNLEPFKIVEGLLLKSNQYDTRFKFRIEMGWGNNVEELFQWDGNVKVRKGRIMEVEPCFRGRSVLAPGVGDATGGENINKINNRILRTAEGEIEWQCFTIKNPSPVQPQTCAVILEIEGAYDTEIEINVNGITRQLMVEELCAYGYSAQVKPWHSQAFKVHRMISQSQYTIEGEVEDVSDGTDFYHMEVIQQNGQCAYVSPVFYN